MGFHKISHGLFLIEPFCRSQTDIEEIIRYGKQYLTICCCLSFGMFTQIMTERLLQATGKIIYSMFTQGTGAIVNIIMDPIMIFGLFGFPKMGVAGAAAAAVSVGFLIRINQKIISKIPYTGKLHDKK